MPIDPRIAMGVQPFQMPMQDPNAGMNALANVMKVRALRDESDMNRLKADEYKRGLEDTNKLNQLYSGVIGPDGKIDRTKLLTGAATGGLGAKIPGLQKQFLEEDKGAAEVDDKKSASEKRRYDMAEKGYSIFQKTLAAHATSPQPDAMRVVQDIGQLVVAGVMDKDKAQQLVANIPQNPAELSAYLRNALSSQMSPEHMLTAFAPKPKEVTNGQQKYMVDENPNSPTYGKQTGMAPVQMQMTPGETATDRRAREQLAETKRHHGQTEKNQATGLELQREAARTEIKETAEGWMFIDKGTKQVTPLKGADGKPIGPKLKDMPAPAQNAMLTNATNKARAERALTLLEGIDIGDPAKGGQTGDKAATGLKGYLPNQLLNRVDPKGVDARAAIADLGSLVIHERSGAAVTAAEFPRLAPFIPTEKDDHDTAKKKLRRFIQVYNDEMAGMQQVYSRENGYRGGAAGGTPTGQALLDQADAIIRGGR